MGPYTITGTTGDQWFLTESSKTWTVAKGAKVITDGTKGSGGGTSISEYKDFSNNHIVIQGLVRPGDNTTFGIDSGGTNTSIVIDTTGRIDTDLGSGIFLHGTSQSIINAGKLTTGYMGIYALHSTFIENHGLIRTPYAIVLASETMQVINGQDGRIVSSGRAIDSDSDAGTFSQFRNNGYIEGSEVAFLGGKGDETFTNSGKIVGRVDLGSGADTFDNRRGDVSGKIIGGDGSDTLVTDDAHVRLSEAATGGFDFVRSTVSYTLNANVECLELLGLRDIDGTGNDRANSMQGNSGDNLLRGLGGADFLQGRFGDDTLFGGGGVDTFIFENGCGKDVVADFRPGQDVINLADLDAITDFADLQANHVKDMGQDLLIRAGQVSIRIQDMDPGDLDMADFLF